MHLKLAGRLPLADMIKSVIEESHTKLAAASGDDKEKVRKLVAYEKKEHGHVPSEKEEEAEKKSSVLDYSDPEDVEKLASALESIAEEFEKEADGAYHGGEYKGGGEMLADMKPVAGKQSYKKDSSKSHNVPAATGLQKGDGGGPAGTQVPNDHAKAPGGAPYPKKGVMKTAAESVMDKIQSAAKAKKPVEEPSQDEETEEEEAEQTEQPAKTASTAVSRLQEALQKMAEFPPKKDDKDKKDDGDKDDKKEDKGEKKMAPPFAKKDDKKDEKKDGDKGDDKGEEKKASAVDFILDKLAEGEVERRMGGETLDSKSGDGPKPPSQPGRQLISSNAAATNAKKVDAKSIQKPKLKEVLTEPAMSKAHDSKVQDNLRNASKGGVKIAAARALLQKIAEDGCSCDGKGECKYCKMKKAMEKKSTGGMPSSISPAPASSPSPSM